MILIRLAHDIDGGLDPRAGRVSHLEAQLAGIALAKGRQRNGKKQENDDRESLEQRFPLWLMLSVQCEEKRL